MSSRGSVLYIFLPFFLNFITRIFASILSFLMLHQDVFLRRMAEHVLCVRPTDPSLVDDLLPSLLVRFGQLRAQISRGSKTLEPCSKT